MDQEQVDIVKLQSLERSVQALLSGDARFAEGLGGDEEALAG